MGGLGTFRQFVYKFGPYLMVEALLPGGTLLALLLFLYRGRKVHAASGAHGHGFGATRAVCPDHTNSLT
jgi:hypothetical protein